MQFMLLKLTLVRTFFVKLFFGRHEQFAAKIMNKTETRRMIKTLENAAVCCHECGAKWGRLQRWMFFYLERHMSRVW